MSSKHTLQENELLSTEPPNTRLERTAEERDRSTATHYASLVELHFISIAAPLPTHMTAQ